MMTKQIQTWHIAESRSKPVNNKTDFSLCTQLLIIGTGGGARGGGSRKALKEHLRPNCEPVDSPPPPHIGTQSHEIIIF